LNDDFLKNAVNFHGHLGPFLILGLKMGEFAKNYIQPVDYKDISASILIEPLETPLSCILDGIQIASGCTIGKRNIEVKQRDSKGIEAIFEGNNHKIWIKVNDIALGVILHNLTDHHGSNHHHGSMEDVAKDIIEKDFDALFEYKKIK